MKMGSAISALVLTSALFVVLLPPAARAIEEPSLSWVQQFGTPNRDVATGMTQDATGLYVAGCTNGSLPGQASAGWADGFLRKYDRGGNELWTRQFGSPGQDCARGVSSDGAGVYVAGATWDALPGQVSAGAEDGFLRKYDLQGNEAWTVQFGTTQPDEVRGVSATGAAVYVAGLTFGILPGQNSTGPADPFVRVYDVNGTERWTRQFGSPAVDAAFAIGADASGVYVAGVTPGTLPGQVSAGGLDGFARAYDLNGTERWTRQFGTAANDEIEGLALDATGVYVSGFTLDAFPGYANSGYADAFVRKFDPEGNELWTRQFGTPGGDSASGIAANATVVYVAGFTDRLLSGPSSAGLTDAFVRKYDSDGSEAWTQQFGSPGGDFAVAISVDSSGVYVAGDTDGAFPGWTNAGEQDVFVARTIVLVPAVHVEPAEVDFGDLRVGSTAMANVTISNVGAANLTVRGVSLATGGSGFSLVSAPATPFVLPVGARADIEIAFAPPAAGPAADAVQLLSDDPDRALVEIPLRGAGVVIRPDTSLVVGSPNFTNSMRYVTSSTALSFLAIDSSGTGIRQTAYRIDGGPWVDYASTGPFTLAGDREHQMEWFSEDSLGDVEPTRSERLRVDDTAPVTSLSPSGPPFPSGIGFTLSASDAGSGVDHAEFRIDGGGWIAYSGAFAVSAGKHVIGYRSVDHIGNVEDERTLDVTIESAPPTAANWKPWVARVYTVALLLIGAWSSRRSPWKAGRGRRAPAVDFALFALPFALLEAATGVVSLQTGLLSIPPVFGVGTVVDGTILCAGVAVATYRALRAPHTTLPIRSVDRR